MLTITIDRELDQPVYAQVAHQVRQLIASGELVPETALPSVRRLAGDLGVNLNTVARAYRLLEEEGFLIIRGRSGVKVSAPAPEVEEATRARLVKELRTTLAKFRQAGMTPEQLMEVVQRELSVLDEKGSES